MTTGLLIPMTGLRTAPRNGYAAVPGVRTHRNDNTDSVRTADITHEVMSDARPVVKDINVNEM